MAISSGNEHNQYNRNIGMVSLLKTNDRGWNILLFGDRNKLETCICEECGSICCDAVELGCANVNHSDDDIFLYCNDCLNDLIKQNDGKCPIDAHNNPIIIANRSSRRQISKSIVLCPYSTAYKTGNTMLNVGQIIDTLDGDEKEGQKVAIAKKQIGCDWNGNLNDLINKHLPECTKQYNPSFTLNIKFNELQNEINTKNEVIVALQNDIVTYKNDIEILENDRTHLLKQLKLLSDVNEEWEEKFNQLNDVYIAHKSDKQKLITNFQNEMKHAQETEELADQENILLKNDPSLPIIKNIRIESTNTNSAVVKWKGQSIFMRVNCVNSDIETNSKLILLGDDISGQHMKTYSHKMNELQSNYKYNLLFDVLQDAEKETIFQSTSISFMFFTSSASDNTLIVDENEIKILDANHKYEFNKVIIKSCGTLTVHAWDSQSKTGGTLLIKSLNEFIIMENAKIELTGKGYCGGKNCYTGESYNKPSLRQGQHNYGGGGAGGFNCEYGTHGKTNTYPSRKYDNGGVSYGDKEISVLHLGSGGGGMGIGGNGAGALQIECVCLENRGKIIVNGESGGGAGCGSGGSIVIKCDEFVMNANSIIHACGGKNRNDSQGGDGGDGRIRINIKNKSTIAKYVNAQQIKPNPFVG
eukprot:511839_1